MSNDREPGRDPGPGNFVVTDRRQRERVPVRTIATTIGAVVATWLAWWFVQQVGYILQLIAIALFFTLALNPAVDLLEHKAKMHRGLAASVVFLVGALGLFVLLYLFVRPLIEQALDLVDRFPQLVEDAQNGRGGIGELVERYDIDRWVTDNQDRIRDALTNSTASLLALASTVASTVIGILTVLVLTFLMLLEGPQMLRAPLAFFAPDTRDHIRRVASDSARAVNRYVLGGLCIASIAASVAYITLRLTGVEFAAVLGVWVGFSALVPMIGATIGAIPTVAVAFLHSTRAGVINLIVYVVYQQFENHVLQTTIMARTVRLNPLIVLISVLLGVATAGFVGALFAIPAAGVLQVVGRDLIETYRHKLPSSSVDGTDAGATEDNQPATTEKD